MKRVTGIGGIFFKSADPKALGAWHKTHLGLDVEEWGGAEFGKRMVQAWVDFTNAVTQSTPAWLSTQQHVGAELAGTRRRTWGRKSLRHRPLRG